MHAGMSAACDERTHAFAYFEERFDVDEIFRRIFDLLHHGNGIRTRENTLTVHDQNGHGKAKENLRSFKKKTVPDAQQGLERHAVDENSHEPVQRQRGDFHFVDFEVLMDVRRLLLDQIFQNELIHLSADQTGVVVVIQMVLGDRYEQPKCIVGLEMKQRHGHDEIHSLAIANARIVQTEYLQHLP